MESLSPVFSSLQDELGLEPASIDFQSILSRLTTGNRLLDAAVGLVLALVFTEYGLDYENAAADLGRFIKQWFQRIFFRKREFKATVDVGVRHSLANITWVIPPPVLAIAHKVETTLKPKSFHAINTVTRSDVQATITYLPSFEKPVEIERGYFLSSSVASSNEQLAQTAMDHVLEFNYQLSSYDDFAPAIVQKVQTWIDEYNEHMAEEAKRVQKIFQVSYRGVRANSQTVRVSNFYSSKSFETLYFEEKERVLKQIDHFLHHPEWYTDRGISRTLGILCYGDPGCGKTTFIKALMKYTRRHGVLVPINKFTSMEQLESLMTQEKLDQYPVPQGDRIYIMEDIDAMGDIVLDRKKKEKKKRKSKSYFEAKLADLQNKMGLSSSNQHLGFLLNLLDGMVEMPGRIIVMTTNHVSKLDPALLRPGRVDIMLEFKRCTRQIIRESIAKFFEMKCEDIQIPEEVTDRLLTPAEVMELLRLKRDDYEGALQALSLAAEERKKCPETRLVGVKLADKLGFVGIGEQDDATVNEEEDDSGSETADDGAPEEAADVKESGALEDSSSLEKGTGAKNGGLLCGKEADKDLKISVSTAVSDKSGGSTSAQSHCESTPSCAPLSGRLATSTQDGGVATPEDFEGAPLEKAALKDESQVTSAETRACSLSPRSANCD